MYDFLIGGKTGASRSLVVRLFDHNSLSSWPTPVHHPDSIPLCFVGAGSSSNRRNHFNLHQNERISHGYSSDAKSL
jgi:hypothetical protein